MISESRKDDDGDEESDSDKNDAETKSTAKRKWYGHTESSLIEKWVTGVRATAKQEDIERERFDLSKLSLCQQAG